MPISLKIGHCTTTTGNVMYDDSHIMPPLLQRRCDKHAQRPAADGHIVHCRRSSDPDRRIRSHRQSRSCTRGGRPIRLPSQLGDEGLPGGSRPDDCRDRLPALVTLPLLPKRLGRCTQGMRGSDSPSRKPEFEVYFNCRSVF